MRTAVLRLDGMISVCDGRGVEKRLLRHAGIRGVDANFLAGTATVEYDENRVTLADLKRVLSECGHHCAGECLPEHVCKPEDPPGEHAAEHHPPPERLAHRNMKVTSCQARRAAQPWPTRWGTPLQLFQARPDVRVRARRGSFAWVELAGNSNLFDNPLAALQEEFSSPRGSLGASS